MCTEHQKKREEKFLLLSLKKQIGAQKFETHDALVLMEYRVTEIWNPWPGSTIFLYNSYIGYLNNSTKY